jgi:hypothetical protein
MHSTNYTNTLILVSADCPVAAGTVPARPGTVAAIQYELLKTAPYELTSDELLLAVEARRKNVAQAKLDDLRKALFSKPQACLRTSPLVKSFGWGLHHDANGKLALVGCETEHYRQMADNSKIEKTRGMRSRRA